MHISQERRTWRAAIAVMGILAICWVIESINYLKDKTEKFYYWIKYRNWRYD